MKMTPMYSLLTSKAFEMKSICSGKKCSGKNVLVVDHGCRII